MLPCYFICRIFIDYIINLMYLFCLFVFLIMLFILYKNIRLKGALTEKPYNFTFRSWESSKNYSIDVTDGSNLSLQVFLKNNEVLRVLATSNVSLNEEWLSDKSKYVYDSLYISRLNNNSLKYNYNSTISLSTSKIYENKVVFSILKSLVQSYSEKFLNTTFTSSINFQNSDEDELNSLISNFNYISNSSLNFKTKSNLTNFYKNKTLDNNLLKSQSSFLLFVAPKLEAWILNYKLLNIQRKKAYQVFGLNNWFDFGFKYKNLGFSNNLLNNFIFNKLSYSKRLLVNNSNNLIFVGNQFLNLNNSTNQLGIFNNLNKFYKKTYNFVNNIYFVAPTFNSYYLHNNSYKDNKFNKLNFLNKVVDNNLFNSLFTCNILYYSQLPYSNTNTSYLFLKKYSILEKKLV